MESDDDAIQVDNPRYSRDERFRKALKILRDGHISLLDFLHHILKSEKAEFVTYRDRFYANPSGKLTTLLDYIFEDKRGHGVFSAWMEPHAIAFVSDKVATEMDLIKTALAWSVNTATPDSLLSWDIDAKVGPLVDSYAPTLGHLLRTADRFDPKLLTLAHLDHDGVRSISSIVISSYLGCLEALERRNRDRNGFRTKEKGD